MTGELDDLTVDELRAKVRTADAMYRRRVAEVEQLQETLKGIVERILEAQADLQTALGFYRMDHARGDPTEQRMAQGLVRLHVLLEALGRPMSSAYTQNRPMGSDGG